MRNAKLKPFEMMQYIRESQKQVNYQSFITLLYEKVILKKEIFENPY